ncbi:MAG TPA: DUF1707 domain-containing protein [Arachnia sp.]|nr:DUF1707 domain-containing protein [Arachnia sp.]HMT85844.1 DUF1707 domain-containing protein [Arachnia sp.]
MTALPPERRLRAGDAERDAALVVLQQAFEAGRLSLEEMSERQERALQITYVDEVAGIVADLPEGDALAPAPLGQPATPARAPRPKVPVAPPDGGIGVAILSGRDRVYEYGTTEAAGIAFWGGDNIDLTEAMGPGVTFTLTLSAIMGGFDVTVPEGVRVTDESIAIMAGNEVKRSARGDGSNGTLILRGFLFWGGSTVRLAKN